MKTYPIKCRLRVENAATRVDIFDDIGDGGWAGGLGAQDFRAQLANVTGPLDVHINSYGGSVADGIAIGNAIRDHAGPKRTIVDGMAASIASVIMQAGDERIVQPGAMVMIHDASTVCQGNAAEMAKTAADLDKHSQNLATQYAQRAGGSPEQWRTAMQAETWYTADEAVAAGLADKVGQGAAALPAGLDLAAFAGVPERIVNRLKELPRQQPQAAYKPQPYKRESWENVCCPVCGCYSDDDAKHCGQCGSMLAGRDDVTSERAPGTDGGGNGEMGDGGSPQPSPSSATEYLRRIAADQRKPTDEERDRLAQVMVDAGVDPNDVLDFVIFGASVDESEWDGPKAMSLAAKSDDPAAAYKQICAGRRDGDPSKQESWALPYKYPGKPVNRAGVRNALSRLPQTEGLTNADAAKALLQRLMKQANPDYDGGDATDAAPSWITQTRPAVPAWLNTTPEEAKTL